MASNAEYAIPKGSVVVVTGANGFIGSNVCDQLLKLGFRVRGTVRSTKRAAWVAEYFNSHYPDKAFELVEVADMASAGAFDKIVQGASGFIHVATPVMQNYDPNVGIPMVVNGALNMLKAAKSEPAIKRVVMTSSSTAAADPLPNTVFEIKEDTWNDAIVEAAWAPPPYEGVKRKLAVYSASKMQSEQAAWKWMKENSPQFTLNTILPNCNIGTVLSPENQGAPSTVGWVRALWDDFKGQEDLKENPPQYYINVQDNAKVHVGALLFPDVKSERLFTFAYPFNWNDILASFRKLYPGKKFPDDYPNLGKDLSKVSNGRALEILGRFEGQKDWTSLDESIKHAVTWA